MMIAWIHVDSCDSCRNSHGKTTERGLQGIDRDVSLQSASFALDVHASDCRAVVHLFLVRSIVLFGDAMDALYLDSTWLYVSRRVRVAPVRPLSIVMSGFTDSGTIVTLSNPQCTARDTEFAVEYMH